MDISEISYHIDISISFMLRYFRGVFVCLELQDGVLGGLSTECKTNGPGESVDSLYALKTERNGDHGCGMLYYWLLH